MLWTPRLAAIAAALSLMTFACTPASENAPAAPEESAGSGLPTPTVQNSLGECARDTNIGVLTTGDDGGESAAQVRGVELATELLNLRGSFNYHAHTEDTGSDPEAARAAFEGFVSEEGVAAVLHTSPSVLETASAPELGDVPLISLFGGDEGVTQAGPNVYSVTLDQPVLAAARETALKEAKVDPSRARSVSATTWTLDSQEGTSLSFVKKFQEKYGEQPDRFAAQGFLAVFLVAAAVERACSNDPAVVARELSKQGETASPMGPFFFTQDREARHPVTLVETIDGEERLFRP